MNICLSLCMDKCFLFLLGKSLGLEWLDHTVGVHLTFKKLPD